MKIKIYCNQLPGGFEPEDIVNGIGGSEEAVILLAEELAKENEVTVYHAQRTARTKKVNGVNWMARHEVKYGVDEIFMVFKDWSIWKHVVNPFRSIHWTCEVEMPWNTNEIDYYVNPSLYCESRNMFVSGKKTKVIPFGVDLQSLDKNQTAKIENTILYCSSPDRGLIQLLHDWQFIKRNHPKLVLNVAYGFEQFDNLTRGNQFAQEFKNRIFQLMQQVDVNYLGHRNKEQIEKLYWQSKYWILPLNLPDSELFCLNAVKAQYCGCIPIVKKIGALKNTVGNYINYNDFVSGSTNLIVEHAMVNPVTWDSVVTQHWNNIIQG